MLFILLSANGQVFYSNQSNFDSIVIQGDVIVRLLPGEVPENIIHRFPPQHGLQIGKLLSKPTNIWLFRYDTNLSDLASVLSDLQTTRGVKQAQANTLVELRVAPNDPNYAQQWQHQQVDAEDAWDITTGGTTIDGHDIVVCIIESTGYTHPDLIGNHWVNTAEIPGNGVDDDGNGYIDDYNGWNVSTNNDVVDAGWNDHGTSVAGMVGAVGNNGVGVAGMNWDVKMMIVSGENSPFTQANIVEAYTYPLEARQLWNTTGGAQGAFVVATNASWGIDGADPASYPIWCNFYDDLGQAGILNCGATTNNNWNVDVTGDMPTACASDFMIGVTATNNADQIDFAGYGVNTINIAAPGSNIYTTENPGYGFTSGTSFASPYTAGLIGLLYSVPCTNLMTLVHANPQGGAEAVRQALYDGVDQNATLQTQVITGGRINAKNSVDLLINAFCDDCQPPTGESASNIGENDAQINFTGNVDADDYTIHYQEQGSGVWNQVTVPGSPYILTGLDPCTTYEFYIESNCGVDVSAPTTTVTFNTECNTGPVVSFAASSLTICEGDCIDLTDLSTGTNISAWDWSFDNGTPATSAIQNPTNICFNTAGSHDITLTVTDDNGTDSHTETIEVQVCATPSANFTTPSFDICEGDCIDFTDLSTGGGITDWSWTFNGAATGTSNNQNPSNICYNTQGTFDVTLQVTNANGSDQITLQVNVQNCSGPTVDFSASSLDICAGDCIALTDLSVGTNINTWDWTFNGAVPLNSGDQNPTNICYDTPGTYQISLTVTDDIGSNTSSQTIIVSNCGNPPISNFEVSGNICEGGCITVTDQSGGGTPTMWNWSFPGGEPATSTAQNPGEICYDTPGDYTITLEVSNADGTNNSTQNLTVYPNPTIDVFGDTIIDLGGIAEIGVITSGVGSYLWSPASFVDCPTCDTTNVSPLLSTEFTVTYIDENGCENTGNVLVVVNLEDLIDVPSAFSPNGDGLNDILYVKGPGIVQMNFMVFNRYGQLVFESTSQQIGWDGTHKGKPLNQGVFVYTLEYTLSNGEDGNKSGNVTLMR